jgi:hypothetical protein
MTTQEHLDAINAAISARLGAGAVESWKDQTHLFAHTPLEKLYGIRADLERQLSQESRGIFVPVINAQHG